MCDALNLDVQPPVAQIDLVVRAYQDFRRNPGDWTTFDAFDWLMRVAASKWASYAAASRVSACRDGAECEEIVDLLG